MDDKQRFAALRVLIGATLTGALPAGFQKSRTRSASQALTDRCSA